MADAEQINKSNYSVPVDFDHEFVCKRKIHVGIGGDGTDTIKMHFQGIFFTGGNLQWK